ncbi:PAS domain S-box protein [Pseudomonas entomophila]|uniref:PAS domain S-box protein n=1 Tax=Pseudomonas entomophila TaxID=312306 RepID=UPI0021590555|nr:PAS domain S-box protein [Pseudomonas entomophila]
MTRSFTPDMTCIDREQPGFLRQGGDVARLLCQSSSVTPLLGAPHDWPMALKTVMATLLPSKAQIVLFWGPEYIALYNDAYAPTIGAKHPHALGRPAIEHWRELWDDLEPLLRGVRETGETFSATDRPFYIERHGLGETAWFDVSYSAVHDEHGEVGGVLCIVTETTERVQFQRRQASLLALSRSLLTLSDPEQIQRAGLCQLGRDLEAARLSLLRCDTRDEPWHVCEAWAEAGTWPADVPLCPVFDAATLDALQQDRVVQDHVVSQGHRSTALYVPIHRAERLEALLVVHMRDTRLVREQQVQWLDEAGKHIWAAAVHARAEQALKASSTQLAAMFEQASAGIVLCDRTWTITRANDRYCDMLGRTRASVLGTRLQDLPDAWMTDLGAARHVGPRQVTRCVLRPDGQPVWVQLQVTRLLHEQDELAGMLCMCIDVTARVQAQAELLALNESLEERVASALAEREATLAELHETRKMEMVGQLTGGIAHDFNNMLTPIIASLELLRLRHDDPRSTRLTDGALQAADRARTLVGRLLSFAQRQTLKPQSVSLATLIGDMRELIGRSLGPTIEIGLDINACLPSVTVDPHQLELAILNLVVNARDAMPQGGRLTLSAGVEAHTAQGIPSVWLRVADTGVGMSEEVLARCMEPFYSTKTIGKSTGLGLPMVQGLALQSQGDFSIRSTQGQGTEVSIWLPASQAACASPCESSSETPMARQVTRVLLVDDEDIVRHATCLQLRTLGYDVTEVGSAACARELIEQGLGVDVLVTDHIMPDMTGARLACLVRQQRPELPVLIITGYANLSPDELQDFDVLRKPFRRAELAQSLARLMTASVVS